jgi:hypothetical protein
LKVGRCVASPIADRKLKTAPATWSLKAASGSKEYGGPSGHWRPTNLPARIPGRSRARRPARHLGPAPATPRASIRRRRRSPTVLAALPVVGEGRRRHARQRPHVRCGVEAWACGSSLGCYARGRAAIENTSGFSHLFSSRR